MEIDSAAVVRIAELHRKIAELCAENEQLKAALRDVYEVWAGSEGFIPKTASEAYQQKIIRNMRDYAAAALREKE